MHRSNVRLCDDELQRDGKKEEGANYAVIPDDAILCHVLLHLRVLLRRRGRKLFIKHFFLNS